MVNLSKILYAGGTSLVVGGGGLGYYYLSGDTNSLNVQQPEKEDNTTLSKDVIQVTQPVDHKDNAVVVTKPSIDQVKPLNKDALDIDIKFSDGDAGKHQSVADKFPEGKGSFQYLIDEVEQLRITDPVFYRRLHDNPFKRSIGLEEAKKKLDVLMDYSLMLSFSAQDQECPIGTGGILDYVLPEGNQKYPTRFLIASNAHVLNVVQFDSSNPYQQVLSQPSIDANVSWKNSFCFSESNQGTKVTLIKEKVQHEESDFDKRGWRASQDTNKGREIWQKDKNKKFNLSNRKNLTDNLDERYWQFTFEKPKLVYFPSNYLKNKQQYHDADLAIFEVDFKDETVAKLFTRDFYGKYNRVNGTKKEQALNLFADPLNKTHTAQQLLEEDVQAGMAGYPSAGMSHKASSNYNLERKSASRLHAWDLRNSDGRLFLGHTSISSSDRGKGRWAGRSSNQLGYLYAFEHAELSIGASGSVVADSSGNVLGLFSLVLPGGNLGAATPFRNMEIRDQDGSVKFDKYDFIEGAEGQNGSYKEQIQKYFLKQGHKTGLSELRNGNPI